MIRLNIVWRETGLGPLVCTMARPRRSLMSSVFLNWSARWAATPHLKYEEKQRYTCLKHWSTHAADRLLQVLYRQKWDETKDRYLLPPDAPELVLAVKNAANYSNVSIRTRDNPATNRKLFFFYLLRTRSKPWFYTRFRNCTRRPGRKRRPCSAHIATVQSCAEWPRLRKSSVM